MYQPGQQSSQDHYPRFHRPRLHLWQPQSHHQWHHLSTSVTPLVAGSRCPITIWPLHNHIRSVIHRAHGHPTSSTTQGPLVTVMRIQKLPSPTSSLVRRHLNLCPFIVSCV